MRAQAVATQVPLWLAVAAPFAALVASVAATSAVIDAGWFDAICEGALPAGTRGVELVEVFWCDLRGAGRGVLTDGVPDLPFTG